MTEKPIFGIDYGTTTTLVSRRHNDKIDLYEIDGNNQSIETVLRLNKPIGQIHIDECYNDRIVEKIGSDAWDEDNDINRYYNFKPDFSPDVTSDSNKLTRIWLYQLFRIIKKDTVVNGADLSEYIYVIGVPAVWDKEKRAALKVLAGECLEKANKMKSKHPEIELCPEPIAAALNCESPGIEQKGKYSLFFDFGGGTLDLCLVKVNDQGDTRIIHTDCNPKLGGRDFDEAIVRSILKDYPAIDPITEFNLKKRASKIKEKIHSKDELYKICISTTDEEISIQGEKFEEVNRNNIQNISETLKKFFAFEEIGRIKDQVKDITLIGGAVKMYFIKDLLEGFLGNDISTNSLYRIGESRHAVVKGLPNLITEKRKFLNAKKEAEVKQKYEEYIEGFNTAIKKTMDKAQSDFTNRFMRIESELAAEIKSDNNNKASKSRNERAIIQRFFKEATDEYLKVCKEHFNTTKHKLDYHLQESCRFAIEKYGKIKQDNAQTNNGKELIVTPPMKIDPGFEIIDLLPYIDLMKWLFPYFFQIQTIRRAIKKTYLHFFSFQEPMKHKSDWKKRGGFFYMINDQFLEQTLKWVDFWKVYQDNFKIWEDE